ncbi:MAG: DUF2490 domain-containing protein [Pseudomonadales bacterium]
MPGLLITAIPSAWAQEASVPNDIGKVRYEYQRRLSDRLRGFGGSSYQQLLSGDTPLGSGEKLTLDGGVSYSGTEWMRLEAGVGTDYTWREGVEDLFEFRLWQAITIDWPEVRALARWVVHHRFMIEERFQFSDDDQASLRGRYRLAFAVPINRYTVEPGAFYLPVAGELYWDIGNNDVELFTNKATVMAGIGYQINKTWAAEFRYRWEESRDTVGGDITRNDNMLELRIKTTRRIVDYLKSR